MNTLKALSLALGEFSRLLVVETGPGDGFLEDRGVRVWPAPPLAIMPPRVPFPVSSRESEPIHTLRLISASLHNRSFIALSRVRYPPPEVRPAPTRKSTPDRLQNN